MKKRKVIPHKQLPVKIPFTAITLQLFLLYFFKAPQWVWGVYLTLLGLFVYGTIRALVNQEKTEIELIPKKQTNDN